MTPLTRTCAHPACEKQFIVSSPYSYLQRKYCSYECRSTRGRIVTPVNYCRTCGKAFDATHKSSCCSKACALVVAQAVHRRHHPTYICQNTTCVKPFTVKDRLSKNRRAKYCSLSCYYAVRRKQPPLCAICGAVVSRRYVKKCAACRSKQAQSKPRQAISRCCRDCGVLLFGQGRYVLCVPCGELSKRRQKRQQEKDHLAIGRELITIFPDLWDVVLDDLEHSSGEERRNRKKNVLKKIGAEGKSLFNLGKRAIQ